MFIYGEFLHTRTHALFYIYNEHPHPTHHRTTANKQKKKSAHQRDTLDMRERIKKEVM